MPKEIVSPQVVANWFANKRKEMRRRSNEEPMPHRLIQQNSENGDDPLTGTPSPLTPMDSANNLMEAENSCDLFQQFSNPFKAAFLNSAFTNSQNNDSSNSMLMDSSTNSSPPALSIASEPLSNFDALMQSGLFNNLIGVYQQQQQQQHLQQQLQHHHHHQQQQLNHQQSSNQSNNNNTNFVIKMEQTAE